MDLRAIAAAVKTANQTNEIDALLNEHYAPDCVSVEAEAGDGMDRVSEGLDAIRAKHAWWAETFEVHSVEITGPFVHAPDKFALLFSIDVTHKPSGERSQMQEVALYTVADDRIVREEFFYPT